MRSTDEGDGPIELGLFDVRELDRLLPALESGAVRFEIRGGECGFPRAAERVFGNPSNPARLTVLVAAGAVDRARAIAAETFPTWDPR
jgi:hypothetical protein